MHVPRQLSTSHLPVIAPHPHIHTPYFESAFITQSAPRTMQQAYRQSSRVASDILALPQRYGKLYEEFIVANASSIGSIESALRSLTYIIPGRFRDAEIASESCMSWLVSPSQLSNYSQCTLVSS